MKEKKLKVSEREKLQLLGNQKQVCFGISALQAVP